MARSLRLAARGCIVSLMPADAIKATVEGLLGALGARVDSINVSEGARTVVAVSSPDAKLLIGPHGETLQALNILARRLVETKMRVGELPAQPHSYDLQTEFKDRNYGAGDAAINFLIDVDGYHESKLKDLRDAAKLLAERARLFKHEVELPPMSSYERLVIHEMFANDPEIETVSTGEGKFRHIVLRYKSNEASSF